MQHPRDLRIENFTYDLPDERIAKYPLEQRDASKLLVYHSSNGQMQEDTYRNIAAYIPGETLLVFNQTKVVHARLLFRKETGSIIEVFCLEPASRYPDIQTAMLQKEKVYWNCMIGGASKWKHGMSLHIQMPEAGFTLSAAIADRQPGYFTLEFTWNNPELTFAEVLHHAGKVPLPPYLHREAEAGDEDRYQTIYARNEGSVAAPTAGLHFTENVMLQLQQKHIDTAFVTLHVGAGTFKPVKAETMAGHDMHAEWIDVTQDCIKQLIAHLDKGIVTVGTTSMRTVESLYWIGAKMLSGDHIDLAGIAIHQWDPYEITTDATPAAALNALLQWMQQHNQERLVTRTQILIAPGYDVKIVKGLITNFHQPQSTLLLLVSALTGSNWRNIYDYAMQHDFRFLSYGDGCLIWK
ncbi:S-adenosylmethionine:tRNA ribosyltransferase-isomerase [Chitinophagaceae bacterium MMS25-I14]